MGCWSLVFRCAMEVGRSSGLGSHQMSDRIPSPKYETWLDFVVNRTTFLGRPRGIEHVPLPCSTAHSSSFEWVSTASIFPSGCSVVQVFGRYEDEWHAAGPHHHELRSRDCNSDCAVLKDVDFAVLSTHLTSLIKFDHIFGPLSI